MSSAFKVSQFGHPCYNESPWNSDTWLILLPVQHANTKYFPGCEYGYHVSTVLCCTDMIRGECGGAEGGSTETVDLEYCWHLILLPAVHTYMRLIVNTADA
jgi:hypothetical protein